MSKEKTNTAASPLRKGIRCPQKTGINMNMHEKRSGAVATAVAGAAVIVLLAAAVAKFGVIDLYRRQDAAQAASTEQRSRSSTGAPENWRMTPPASSRMTPAAA